jgi:N6-L-threonylcarbamoyladenine synthase
VRVLGIESSCDELSCAVLDPDGTTVRCNIVHSQEDLHARFGGIVPEVASRDHVKRLEAVLVRALQTADVTMGDIDGLAVTRGPGLVGSLLCGLEFAKGLSLATGLPWIGVHHLEGHLATPMLEGSCIEPPFTALLVSGGHTLLLEVGGWTGPYRVLGRSRDDAAGEAFDKTAKLLGLGYPGGAIIDRLAASGDEHAVPMPRLMAGKDNFDFSFSGLKTHVRRQVADRKSWTESERADFCASFQRAVTENLLQKSFRAARRTGRLILVGGVAANRRLRERALMRGRREGIEVHLPSRAYCTDNGAMIARAGWVRLVRGERSPLHLDAQARWDLRELPVLH